MCIQVLAILADGIPDRVTVALRFPRGSWRHRNRSCVQTILNSRSHWAIVVKRTRLPRWFERLYVSSKFKVMSKAKKNSKGSVYALRKSRQDFYVKYSDDGKSKDVGPAMIMIKDEDEDRIDSPFPAAFSPTENNTTYSLDIDLHLDVPEDEEQKSGMAELYAQVVPKSQRAENADSYKKGAEASEEAIVSNGDATVSVDPYSKYAKVVPRSQRSKPAEETNGKPASNGHVTRSDNDKLKIEARSKVLSAIGSEPITIQNGEIETSYRPTAQRIDNALGGKITYNESAEL